MRVDNLDNYFNAYSDDPINQEGIFLQYDNLQFLIRRMLRFSLHVSFVPCAVLDRLERVEKAYSALSQKVKGYLKQLHQQGMITVPIEVLE
jgi:hypothetical protein